MENSIFQYRRGVTRLFCSYVGHEVQELKLVPGKDQYEITLFPSAQMLDAVVVTGIRQWNAVS